MSTMTEPEGTPKNKKENKEKLWRNTQ